MSSLWRGLIWGGRWTDEFMLGFEGIGLSASKREGGGHEGQARVYVSGWAGERSWAHVEGGGYDSRPSLLPRGWGEEGLQSTYTVTEIHG